MSKQKAVKKQTAKKSIKLRYPIEPKQPIKPSGWYVEGDGETLYVNGKEVIMVGSDETADLAWITIYEQAPKEKRARMAMAERIAHLILGKQ